MNYADRQIRRDEWPLLEGFIYEAIFVPEGFEGEVPRSVIDEYGHIDDDRIVATSGISIVEKPPYFGCPTGKIALVSSMSTLPAYRRQGIARDLLCRSVGFVHNANFLQLSL